MRADQLNASHCEELCLVRHPGSLRRELLAVGSRRREV
jgi:hypothetical protein